MLMSTLCDIYIGTE